MKQLWAALKVTSLTISALASITFVSPAFAQTAASASTAPVNPLPGEKPAILVPNDTKDIQYDLNFGFPDHNGPFSAMVVVIPQKELEEFNKPGGVRHLDRVSRAESGAVLAIKVMVTGLQPDTNGVAKVMTDVQVLAPSGDIYGKSDYKEMPVWVGPAGKGVYDNRDRVVLLKFEPTDPAGVYTIKAVVHDRFAKRDIPLETKVELLPPRSAAAPNAVTSAPASDGQPAAVDATQPADVKPAVKATSKHRKRRH